MRRALSALALLASLAFQAQSGSEVTITRPLWHGREHGSPVLPSSGFGLWFNLEPARASGIRTLALLAAAHLPGRYMDVYGGRIPGAIEVVAIDSDTGRVYHSAAERPGAVPLADAMNPAPGPLPEGVAAVQDAEVWFNLDLRSHLGLPARSGVYNVFLWLDELTSRSARAIVPGTAASSPERPAVAESVSVRWGAPQSSAVPGHAISITFGADRRLHGAASTEVLTGARFLTVIALNFRTRTFTPCSLALPEGAGGGFDLDLNWLPGGPAASPGRVFLVAVIGAALSNVLTLNPGVEGATEPRPEHKL